MTKVSRCMWKHCSFQILQAAADMWCLTLLFLLQGFFCRSFYTQIELDTSRISPLGIKTACVQKLSTYTQLNADNMVRMGTCTYAWTGLFWPFKVLPVYSAQYTCTYVTTAANSKHWTTCVSSVMTTEQKWENFSVIHGECDSFLMWPLPNVEISINIKFGLYCGLVNRNHISVQIT